MRSTGVISPGRSACARVLSMFRRGMAGLTLKWIASPPSYKALLLAGLGATDAHYREEESSRGLPIAYGDSFFTRGGEDDDPIQRNAARRANGQRHEFTIDRTHPGRWTIAFSNPPINMFVPETIDELGALVGQIESDPSLKVVVFESANPDFFIAHLDVCWQGRRAAGGAGPVARLCAAALVHAGGEHRQDSRAHPRHRQRVRAGLRHALRQPAERHLRQPGRWALD